MTQIRPPPHPPIVKKQRPRPDAFVLAMIMENEFWEGRGMDWREFLREECVRKLAHVQMLMSGTVTVTVKTDLCTADIAQIIKEELWLVAEIERTLAAAGIPLDD